jgi:hypothetical protein
VITHFKGNRSPSLTDTIKVNGVAFDLTGSTVVFKMRATNLVTLKVNAAATVVSAPAGTVPSTRNPVITLWDASLAPMPPSVTGAV